MSRSIKCLALLAAPCSLSLAQAQEAPSGEVTPGQQLLVERFVRDAVLAGEANRIVGLWQSTIDLGPCAGGPRMNVRGLNQFHAGGTLTETGSPPPTSRGPGYGVWRYGRASRSYDARMQFARFTTAGQFDGFTDIHRQITLSQDGNVYNDQIVARLLNPDDSLRVELCGTAVGRRQPVL